MSIEDKQSKAVVMKPPSGPLAIRKRGKIKKPPKTALEEEEFTEVAKKTLARWCVYISTLFFCRQWQPLSGEISFLEPQN